MLNPLLNAVSRYLDQHADQTGIAHTPVAGLTTIRSLAPTGLQHAISRPLVCLVLQGTKEVTIGTETLEFNAGDSLLITADVPTVSQVTRASRTAPYLSLVMDLDLAIVSELALQMGEGSGGDGLPVRSAPTDAEVADAALRLMRLLDRPEAVPVLHGQLVRELHYWLLAGRHGAAIRRLGWPDGHVERVTRAVAAIRAGYAGPLRVDELASIAGMSSSSFRHYFREVTSLSPLQFQKQLRLIEARRMMLSEGATASTAAFAVGYESVSQFTREYGRMFGQPPARDSRALKARAGEAA